MEIPDSWLVDMLAKSIEKPDAEARADKLAKLFRERHPLLRGHALLFLERITTLLQEP